MNSNSANCVGFVKCGEFLKAVNDWKYWGGECTYMLVSDPPQTYSGGTSDILFVGYTTELGGVEHSILENYHGQRNETEKRIIDWITQNKNNCKVFLYLCPTPPGNISVKQYVKDLKDQYKSQHNGHLPLLCKR